VYSYVPMLSHDDTDGVRAAACHGTTNVFMDSFD
jgi:hypothetical protein